METVIVSNIDCEVDEILVNEEEIVKDKQLLIKLK